jgi:hypothetical protein
LSCSKLRGAFIADSAVRDDQAGMKLNIRAIVFMSGRITETLRTTTLLPSHHGATLAAARHTSFRDSPMLSWAHLAR